MPTKGSRECDAEVRAATRDMGGVEREKLNVNQVGQEARASNAIGGGDKEGRAGKVQKDA